MRGIGRKNVITERGREIGWREGEGEKRGV